TGSKGIEACGGIAKSATPLERQMFERPFFMAGLVGSPLHGVHLGPNAYGGEVVRYGFDDAGVGRIDAAFPGIETIGIPSFFQELLGLLGVVGVWFNRQGIFELARDNVPRQYRIAQGLRLVD